ncbi:MAG TPA: hypothetical protein VJH92_01695 [Candidatus Nanoarchaeia archaeon]|nr:hypothetical protein [Candidatus Nanoarchaeia archaeon]
MEFYKKWWFYLIIVLVIAIIILVSNNNVRTAVDDTDYSETNRFSGYESPGCGEFDLEASKFCPTMKIEEDCLNYSEDGNRIPGIDDVEYNPWISYCIWRKQECISPVIIC